MEQEFSRTTADAASLQRGSPPYQTPSAIRQSHRSGGTAEPPPKTATEIQVAVFV
ncbi:MAG: hypothetical protein K8L97_17535 [Anaerolineae bacterium]|nr:hypothetical protein [Anaerolineae bacterium]